MTRVQRVAHSVPAKVSASFRAELLSFADDIQCDHLMAAGFACAMLEGAGGNSVTSVDRDAFLTGSSKEEEELYFSMIESSVENERFLYDLFFWSLLELPTPRATALVVAMFYCELVRDGEEELAQALNEEIRRRVRSHLRSM